LRSRRAWRHQGRDPTPGAAHAVATERRRDVRFDEPGWADRSAPAAPAGLIDFDAIRDDGAVRENPFGYDGVDDLLERIDWQVNNYRLIP
jgi:hypothetical protein